MSKKVTDSLIDNLYIKVKKDKGVNKPTFQRYDPGYIYQADLLFLPNDDNYKYTLTVTDVGTRKVDASPLKSKQSKDVIKGFEKIFKRKKLAGKPKIMMVDSGSEFKGDTGKWLKDQGIVIRTGKPYRHRQQAIVEKKNQDIGTALFKRMTAEELLTGETARGWVDDLPEVVDNINTKITKEESRKPNLNTNVMVMRAMLWHKAQKSELHLTLRLTLLLEKDYRATFETVILDGE
eukprot:Lithocolla_globosa_v1_NODE_791_length_3276_cov_48.918348.p2 type:complete len:235 gc:universal NODE_791_length_3276_cov_48.918348:2379-3083(+)